ncbi:MAG: NAD(P)-dependent oxidoreductase [Thermodesulfovibrionales bacterium]|nr:NAD(P)-dependent oxidoreductase [Thermodesulfovibrionales bacterium]
MKALVTGATGFIGSHLCEELVRRGYEVTCLVRETSNLKWVEDIALKFITGDCESVESLLDAVVGFDHVFHLAGLTKACSEDDFFCVNAKGTENLIKAVAKKNPKLKRFVYLSSLAAAGPSMNGSPLREDSEPRPVSSYGRSKLEGEKAVLRYKGSIPVTILRASAVYGPRDRDLFIFFKMLKKGIFPHWGKCYYSLLYVDDLIQGVVLAAENRRAEGEIYFLSDSKFYTNEEIATEISSALDAKVIRLRVPRFIMPFFAYIGERIDRHGIINRDKMNELSHSHWICDTKKAREELGFIPRVGIKEGIKWTADWYRIHRWL